MTVPLDADARAATLSEYCRVFETLQPDRLDALRGLCTDDIRFVDPFNDIRGIDRLLALFEHMFRAVAAPRFEVVDQALGATAGYVRWRFTGTVRGRPVAIDGMSEIAFDPSGGRVAAHIDHWDAAGQVYARLPVAGSVLRWLRRLLSAGV